MAEASASAAQGPVPTLPAEDRIRETAKWLTVSLAAVGGLVVTGTQFSNLGAVHVGSPRFWVIVISAALAASGTGLILAGAVKTATTEPVKLSDFTDKGWAQDMALQEGIEGGAPALAKIYKEALDRREQTYHEYVDDNENQFKLRQSERAEARALQLAYIVRNVSRVASYEKVANQWKRSTKMVFWGAVAALLGILAFIWAINPPAAVKASEASPAVIGQVASRMLTLEPAGQRALAKALGQDCKVDQPLEVVHLAKTDTGPDVLVQQDGCKQVRLIITASWGHLQEPAPTLPAQETPKPAPSP